MHVTASRFAERVAALVTSLPAVGECLVPHLAPEGVVGQAVRPVRLADRGRVPQ